MAHRFGKNDRIKHKAEFSRVFDEGRQASDSLLRLYVLANGECGRARLGVAVGARHGGAAKRNRVKRLCREAFRLVREELPVGWDYVMMPHAGKEISLNGLKASLVKLSLPLTRESQEPGT